VKRVTSGLYLTPIRAHREHVVTRDDPNRANGETQLTRLKFALLSAAFCVGALAPSAFADGANGAVFVMTNAADKNEVIAYERNAAGSLQERARYNTEGRGSGGQIDPLQSQGSLAFSPDGSLLYAVNAGSGTVTSFRANGANLIYAGHAPSGGSEPVAVAQFGDLVYVVNAGAAGSVVGFHVDASGHLQQIPGSTRFLTGTYVGGASISFRPDGQFIAVVEREANNLDTFAVNADGTLGTIHSEPSPDPGAFSAQFAPDGALLVSETGPAGASDASAISSYVVNADGTLTAVALSVPTFGDGNCWNAITPDGKYVYVSNSASGSISGFAIGNGGTLTPIGNTVLATLPSGSTNLDMATTADGRFLYTLDAGAGSIGIFSIGDGGVLTFIGTRGGLAPASGFNGIAAR
jgi:6-phosphogluconolactonase